ncbi:MAG TPA: phosphatase PAP2 family protein [Streptosporangiaceae bacterium]|jgi:undecaprenyl-diphosphatase
MRQPPRGGLSPLLSRRGRLAAGIVAATALAIFAAGLPIVHGGYADLADRAIDPWLIARLGSHTTMLNLLDDLGERNPVAAISVVLALVCLAARRVNAAVLALFSAPVAAGLTEKVLKVVADHLNDDATYPSGHATALFALAALVVVLLASPRRQPRSAALRVVICLLAMLIAVAVAVAKLALNDHHFTDVVGGAAIGTAVTLTGALVLDLPVARRLLARFGPRTRRHRATSIEIPRVEQLD